MRTRLVILCSLVLMGVATAADGAWAELRSPRYLFVGDVSKGELRAIAERFEQFASVMERLLSRGSAALSTPTVVVVFKNERGARPFFPVYAGKPRVVAGMAMSGREINYILMNAESGEASYPIIFHELAHLITQNVTRNAAAWYSEGVAEYYSTFDLRSAKEAVLGLPIGRHIGLLRERVVPLTELLAVDLSSPEYNESTKATLFYAQSWALVHMLRSRPSTRDRFSAYMRLSEQGLPQERAIAEGFGVPIAELENELRQYARQFRMTAERWTFEEAVADADLVPRDLSDADAAPHLAALLAWQDRPEEAVTRLKSAAGAAPRSAFTHALLARLEADADRRKEALALLDRDLEYRGFLDHYAAAVILSRLIRRDAPDELSARALELLDLRSRAAIEAQDNVAEAWRLASIVHLARDRVPDAKAAIERALALAPANEYYRFTLVEVLYLQREFVQARAVLGPLVASGRTASVRDEARRLLGAIAKYELFLNASPTGRERPSATTAPPAPVAERPDPVSPTPDRVRAPTAVPDATWLPPGRVTPVFRRVQAGESRVQGTLTAIECGNTSVAVVVLVGGRAIRFRVPSFPQIEFITYRDDPYGAVGCGPRPSEPVYVTWRGGALQSADVTTELVVVEFLPADVKPPPQ